MSVSAARVKRAIGVSAVRATSAPSAAAIAIPATPTMSRINSTWRSSRSTSASGRAIMIAPPRPPPACAGPAPSVSTRRWVPLTVLSLSERPAPRAAIPRSAALSAIFGVEPCPPGTAIAPPAVTNCTYPEAPPKRAGATVGG